MKSRLAKGEQIELENLLMNPAGVYFLNRGILYFIVNTLDNLFNQVCLYRNMMMNEVFSKSLSSFFHLASQTVNENKKIDFKGLIEILTETGGVEYYIKTELDTLDKFIDREIDDIRKGFYGNKIVSDLLDGMEHEGNFEETYKVRTDVVEAWAIELLVDYFILPIRP